MIVEVCVDRVQSAIHAVTGGADRIELCQDLAVGGTTPSMGLVIQTMQAIDKPVICMVRPRGGDFCYDSYEFESMLTDIVRFKELGISGIAIGILTPDGNVDVERMRKVMETACGMEVVFHRAFDMTADLIKALRDLEQLGIARVLTSGGKNTAWDGIETLRTLQNAQSNVTIMAGSGIHEGNVQAFQKIGISEIHLSGKITIPSRMQYRNPCIQMGKKEEGKMNSQDEYGIEETSVEKIRRVVEVLIGEG